MTDIAAESLADANKAILALYEEIGRRIRVLRKERGLTQGELGAVVGLMRSSMSNVEAGRQRIPLHALIALAQCLGTDLQTLCGEKDMPVFARELPARRRDWERDAKAGMARVRADLVRFDASLVRLAERLDGGGDVDA